MACSQRGYVFTWFFAFIMLRDFLYLFKLQLFLSVKPFQQFIRTIIKHKYHLNGDCTRINHSNQGRRGYMPAKWTADLLGEMHLAGVTAKQLAAEVGWNPKYLSVVLNGHKEPKGAEQKLNEALERLKSK
nr:MAG TPA: KorB domain [Caudoviricetes sp.]